MDFSISAAGLISLRMTDFRIRRKQMHNNFSILYGFSCADNRNVAWNK